MEIAQLKEQLNILEQNQKDYQDLNFLYTNLEHRYNIVCEEKMRIENELNKRNEYNLQAIAMHRVEIDTLRQEMQQERVVNQQFKDSIEYLMFENQQLTDEVTNLREAYTKMVEQIQDQDEEYKKNLYNKQQYIENLAFQLKQLNELKNVQEKKFLNDLENKHQQNWKIDNYISEIESIQTQNDKLAKENKQYYKQKERLEQQISNYKDQMNQMTQEIGKLQHSINQLTRELKDSKTKQSNTKELQLELEMKNLKQNNYNYEQKIETYQKQLEVLLSNNQQLMTECEGLRNKVIELQSNKNNIENTIANSLSKMQEERKIIKDYLQKQKLLRENRLNNNDNETSRCLEELSKFARNS